VAKYTTRRFFRGTDFEWERSAMWGAADRAPRLKSYKQELGNPVPQFATLTAQEINQEIIRRVGVETALGTPNPYSHFVPCGTSEHIAKRFGKGKYFSFEIPVVVVLYDLRHLPPKTQIPEDCYTSIQSYLNARAGLPSFVIPVFAGGSQEVLAYTGTAIFSVQEHTTHSVSRCMWSLD